MKCIKKSSQETKLRNGILKLTQLISLSVMEYMLFITKMELLVTWNKKGLK